MIDDTAAITTGVAPCSVPDTAPDACSKIEGRESCEKTLYVSFVRRLVDIVLCITSVQLKIVNPEYMDRALKDLRGTAWDPHPTHKVTLVTCEHRLSPDTEKSTSPHLLLQR
eukprot:7068672-Prymnesium_polylepis.2